MNRRTMLRAIAVAGLILTCTNCGSTVKGTYSDENGAFVLDLKSGGNASFTFGGDTTPCSYTVNGDNLTLDCKGQAGKAVLIIHEDGSLTGPPGSYMPPLKKSKS
jgi:hypothetical protein